MMSLFDRKRLDRGLNHPWMILLAVLFLFSGPASAGDLAPSGNDSVGNEALQGDFELDVFDGFAVAGEAELAEIRGGESTAVSLQDMRSTVEGNVVSGNVTTGSVTIGDGAFTDFGGISSVVINSGNNVSIQSSTVVNIIIGE